METTTQFKVYVEKMKHNGLRWTLASMLKRSLGVLLRYADKTLVIYLADFKKMPLLEAKLDVKYDWIPEDDIAQVLALGFAEVPEATAREYFRNGSRCYGAFLDGRLIAYSWIHFERFYFPFFDYTLKVGPGQVYDGPDYVDPAYRGKRLHEAILTRLAAYLRERDYHSAFGSILKDNVSSQRGVDRAGPRPVEQLRVIKVFGRIVYKKMGAA